MDVRKFALLFVCALVPLSIAYAAGFPSRPRFQSVTVLGDANLNTIDGIAVSDLARLSQSNSFAGSITLEQGSVALQLINSSQALNDKLWQWRTFGDDLRLTLRNDDGTNPVDAIIIDRTGTTVDNIFLQATSVQVNGQAVPKFAAAMCSSTGGLITPMVGVAGCSRGGVGLYDVDITPAGFASEPICVGSPRTSGTSSYSIRVEGTSLNNVTVRTFDASGVLADSGHSIQCMGY